MDVEATAGDGGADAVGESSTPEPPGAAEVLLVSVADETADDALSVADAAAEPAADVADDAASLASSQPAAPITASVAAAATAMVLALR